MRGRNPKELLLEVFSIRARPPPQCYHAALDVALCSESSCPTSQMRPHLYKAAGLAVGRPRARVGGRRGGHGRRAGCFVIEAVAIIERELELELESFYSITTFIGDMGPPPQIRQVAQL